MRSSWGIKIRNYALAGILLYTSFINGQNLVPDPGFEKMDFCPGKGGKNASTLKALSEWWSPNKCSPDYMNRCAKGMDGILNNVGGSQEPAEGDGYAGICHGRKGKYFEFIQTALTKALDSGKTYLVTLHVSFGDKVFYAMNELGVCLSNDKLSSSSKDVLQVKTYVPIRTGEFYTLKDKWMKIQALYQAKGGERFFTIGFFNAFPELQLVGGKLPKAIDGEADDVYYFIDDVSVEEVNLDGKDLQLFMPDLSNVKNPEKGNTKYKLHLEYFKDGTIPLPGGFKHLDSLSSIVFEDSSLKLILLSGSSINQHFRLEFVRQYLIGKGINPARILILKDEETLPDNTIQLMWKS